jgi:hypothetical protein
MRIVTVLQTRGLNGLYRGTSEYTPNHVVALQAQLTKWAPGVPFEVLSDVHVPGVNTRILPHNWPGWWSKMNLLNPSIPGDFLFMDLDTVITGPLDDILAVRKLTLLRDFYRDGKKLKEGLGGGLIYFPVGDERQEVWEFWMQQPQLQMRVFSRGDQFLFEKFWLNSAARWQDAVPDQVVSYKVHCSKGVPPDARVICFHGQPRPWAVGQFLHLYR